jgi:chemotaxis protein MotB
MMAFFLLLWLLASTTQDERAGISDYFTPSETGPSSGTGASDSMIDLGGVQDTPRGKDGEDWQEGAGELIEEQTQEALEKEQVRLESLLEALKESIESSQALKPFKDQLLLEITPEGLRIQIVDKENRPMFDSGSAVLKDYTRKILRELAKTINTVPNKISLTGHTDISRFLSARGYTNWELSADRANASRRELVLGGLSEKKIAKVVGLASMVLFDAQNPRSPINRRIAIVVMNRAAEAALLSAGKQVSSAEQARHILDDKTARKKSIVGAIEVKRPRETVEKPQQFKKQDVTTKKQQGGDAKVTDKSLIDIAPIKLPVVPDVLSR